MAINNNKDDSSILEERDRPIYLISIVAEMLEVHPQTLRTYEREGFVSPSRTGGQRLYSRADVERLALVLDLTKNLGVNRAGVDIILRMQKRLEGLQEEVEIILESLESEKREEFVGKIRHILESQH
jgi:MerR family transcriptional regulator/heat shock protein HspR